MRRMKRKSFQERYTRHLNSLQDKPLLLSFRTNVLTIKIFSVVDVSEKQNLNFLIANALK